MPISRKRVASAPSGAGVEEGALMLLLQPSALVEGDVIDRAVRGALEGADVGNHGPAIVGGQLVGVGHHRVLAVGDGVEDLTLGHVADAVVVIGGRGDRKSTRLNSSHQ